MDGIASSPKAAASAASTDAHRPGMPGRGAPTWRAASFQVAHAGWWRARAWSGMVAVHPASESVSQVAQPVVQGSVAQPLNVQILAGVSPGQAFRANANRVLSVTCPARKAAGASATSELPVPAPRTAVLTAGGPSPCPLRPPPKDQSHPLSQPCRGKNGRNWVPMGGRGVPMTMPAPSSVLYSGTVFGPPPGAPPGGAGEWRTVEYFGDTTFV